MFLPSLLHLALLLFAVGLTVYLWKVHLGAAIPVLLITFASVATYGVSTVLPLLYEHCPYSTPLSKLVYILPKPQFLRQLVNWIQAVTPSGAPVSQPEPDEDLMDDLTSRALAWLIVNYEDTKSADIALQAIAGATAKLPILPLHDSGVHGLLEQRLRNCFNTRQTTEKIYLKDQGLLEVASLYSRALVAPRTFHPEMPGPWDRAHWSHYLVGQLLMCLVDGISLSSLSPNKAAFALASISVTRGTRIWSGEIRNTLDPSAYIVLTDHLLRLHLKDKITLEASALSALLRAATHWPGFKLAAGCITDHTRLMVTLVQVLSTLSPWAMTQMQALVGTALTAFACSKRNYSRWPQHNHSDEGDPSYQAHTLAMQYEHSPPSPDTHVDSLVTFGLLEFIKHHGETLDDDDLHTLVKALDEYCRRSATIDIFSLPKKAFGSDYHYMLNTLTPMLKSDGNGVYAYSEAVRAVCFSAFNSRDFFEYCPQTVGIYILALENLRAARSSLLKRTSFTLLASNSLSGVDGLVGQLRHHNPIPLCLGILHCEDERVVPYIMSRLYAIILIVNELAQSPAEKSTILQPLLSYEPFLGAARGSYSLTLDTLERACVEAWLPRLGEMVDRIPRHVDESDIIFHIEREFLQGNPQGKSHPLYESITTLSSRLEQTCRDGPLDWS
ncbi:hypothetical protein FRC08_006520 [Ceratobasidium sp. 394]|nr:hypothetical protein FRC08_006520 [Ceratobasidium sp. 394]